MTPRRLVSPVSRRSGTPVFIAKDVPYKTEVPSLELEQPQVYFGERLDGYVVVGTKRPGDQLPRADRTEYTEYDGDDGVQPRRFVKRAAFALRFAEPNLLISNQVTSESKVLYIRDIRERAEKSWRRSSHFDADPYPVILDGRVQWVLDAYTTTDRYPARAARRHRPASPAAAEPRPRLQLRAELGEDGGRRLRRQRRLLRDGPRRPDHRGLPRRLPEAVHRRRRHARRARGATCATRRTSSGSRRPCGRSTTCPTRRSSTAATTTGTSPSTRAPRSARANRTTQLHHRGAGRRHQHRVGQPVPPHPHRAVLPVHAARLRRAGVRAPAPVRAVRRGRREPGAHRVHGRPGATAPTTGSSRCT